MEDRRNAACAVFEGKIVVSGGCNNNTKIRRTAVARRRILKQVILNSVESYDYHENKWSYFPCMLSKRANHTAVSIGNKLFMIGGSSNNSEVFDSVTKISHLSKVCQSGRKVYTQTEQFVLVTTFIFS